MKRNPCEQHADMATQVAGDGYSCIYCLYSLAEKDIADLQFKLSSCLEALRECRRLADESKEAFLEDAPRWLASIYTTANDALGTPKEPKPPLDSPADAVRQSAEEHKP